jgi:hypothetical protein
VPRGATITPDQAARLGAIWYADRVSRDWRPKTPAVMNALLASVGLSGSFWTVP